MSLTVSPDLLDAAERGEVSDAAFVDCVRESLPYAWTVVSEVAGAVAAGAGFADHSTPPSDAERGQLLRAFASDAIRGGLERHFGVRLAFQNCHRVAAFPTGQAGAAAHAEFTSTRAQLRNQSPTLRNC